MTASSAVVLGNLAYLIGAVVLAVIGGLVVWLFNRKPQSTSANVESFHRSLQALAPNANQSGSGGNTQPRGLRIQPRPDDEPDDAARSENPAIEDTATAVEADIGTNGSTAPRLLHPDHSNGSTPPRPLHPDHSNGSTAPRPLRPDLPDLTFPPLIDEAGSNGHVAGQAGAETG